MAKHLKVLGALHVVVAGANVLMGLLMLAFLAAFKEFVVGRVLGMPPEASVAAALAGIVPLVLVLASLPGLLAGMGLLGRKRWARILALVVAGCQIWIVPLGTALGVYSFWVLLDDRTVELLE